MHFREQAHQFARILVVAIAGAAAGCDTALQTAPTPTQTGKSTAAAPGLPPVDARAPRLRMKIDPAAVQLEGGYAWVVVLPERFADVADSNEAPQASPLQLTEDGTPLGPAHAQHETIRKQGRGAYSHWVDRLYFSTSDNTNPTQNGRTYEIELPGQPSRGNGR